MLQAAHLDKASQFNGSPESKKLLLWMLLELIDRAPAAVAKGGMRLYSVDPGFVLTNNVLMADGISRVLGLVVRLLSVFAQPPAQGVATHVWLGTKAEPPPSGMYSKLKRVSIPAHITEHPDRARSWEVAERALELKPLPHGGRL